MTLEEKVAGGFGMDATTWERHANPWSVWTRFTAWPGIALAVWSRKWLGRWAIVPLVASLVWTWINPRIFGKPRSTDNWASKGVLGERVWMNRSRIPIPERHRRLPNVLSAISGIGGVIGIWGLLTLRGWPTLLGTALIYLGKLWFIDRMVWIYEDMKDANPEYASWLRR